MKPKSILIGMPSGSGVVPTQMVQSLLQLHKPLPCGFMTIERQRVDKARNAMVMEALNGGFDYLFMVDDDNPIPPDTLEKFLDGDKDIVAAPILGRNPNKDGVHSLCTFYAKTVQADGKPIRLYYPIEKFKDEGPLHKVDAVGTGCLLIKRNVLETLIKKHKDGLFEFGDIKFKKKITVDGKEYDRRTMSEDCEFSERAVDAGFEIYVDERIRPIHLTSQGFVQWPAGK
jgi:GT2 family glycosyltransferase